METTGYEGWTVRPFTRDNGDVEVVYIEDVDGKPYKYRDTLSIHSKRMFRPHEGLVVFEGSEARYCLTDDTLHVMYCEKVIEGKDGPNVFVDRIARNIDVDYSRYNDDFIPYIIPFSELNSVVIPPPNKKRHIFFVISDDASSLHSVFFANSVKGKLYKKLRNAKPTIYDVNRVTIPKEVSRTIRENERFKERFESFLERNEYTYASFNSLFESYGRALDNNNNNNNNDDTLLGKRRQIYHDCEPPLKIKKNK